MGRAEVLTAFSLMALLYGRRSNISLSRMLAGPLSGDNVVLELIPACDGLYLFTFLNEYLFTCSFWLCWVFVAARAFL